MTDTVIRLERHALESSRNPYIISISVRVLCHLSVLFKSDGSLGASCDCLGAETARASRRKLRHPAPSAADACPAAAASGTLLAAPLAVAEDTPDIGELAAGRQSCTVGLVLGSACSAACSAAASVARQRVAPLETRQLTRHRRHWRQRARAR